MARDLYDALIGFYEFIMGPLPRREEFRRTLQETVTADELRVFFLIPFSGRVPLGRLARKARMAPQALKPVMDRLASEGLVMAYLEPGGPVYERANPVYMTEQQVRKPEDTPRRQSYARFFNAILSGEFSVAAPNKTPYYRVLPVEDTVAEPQGRRTVAVNVPVPDPRGVLPVDVISEMVRRNSAYIALADCYCRKTRRLVGQGCEYPLETCLVFGKIAESLVVYGTARRIDYDEAMAIIRRSEELGLVHNVDNCEGEIGSICNCCPCCSVLLNSWRRGLRNADAPSRYVVEYAPDRCVVCEKCLARCPTGARTLGEGKMAVDPSLCLGCGLCASACAQGANRMVLRSRQPRIPRTAGELNSRLTREAMVGIVKKKLLALRALWPASC